MHYEMSYSPIAAFRSKLALLARVILLKFMLTNNNNKDDE